MEFVTFGEIVERARKERNVVLQADALAGFNKVLAPDLAEVRVMENQVAELRALLDEIHLGKTFHLVMKSVEADQLAKNDSRVVEAERLVKVTGQKKLFSHVLVLLLLPFLVGPLWEASSPSPNTL